jgi:hypothetical protein
MISEGIPSKEQRARVELIFSVSLQNFTDDPRRDSVKKADPHLKLRIFHYGGGGERGRRNGP